MQRCNGEFVNETSGSTRSQAEKVSRFCAFTKNFTLTPPSQLRLTLSGSV